VKLRNSQAIENMERETGIEPATSSLGSWHSTAELLPPNLQDVSLNLPHQSRSVNNQQDRHHGPRYCQLACHIGAVPDLPSPDPSTP
jgi:hypothetical protein